MKRNSLMITICLFCSTYLPAQHTIKINTQLKYLDIDEDEIVDYYSEIKKLKHFNK